LDFFKKRMQAELVELDRKIKKLEESRKSDQHRKNLEERLRRIEGMMPEVEQRVLLLDSQLAKPTTSVKSFATTPVNVSASLFRAAVRDRMEPFYHDIGDVFDKETEVRNEEPTIGVGIEALKELEKLVDDMAKKVDLLSYENRKLKRESRSFKKASQRIAREFSNWTLNHELRINVMEENSHLVAHDTFSDDYAEYLDRRGYFALDSLVKEQQLSVIPDLATPVLVQAIPKTTRVPVVLTPETKEDLPDTGFHVPVPGRKVPGYSFERQKLDTRFLTFSLTY
jgi:hypothetical protein